LYSVIMLAAASAFAAFLAAGKGKRKKRGTE